VSHPPLELSVTPERLHALQAAGVLSPAAHARALALSCETPPARAWRRFLSASLLGAGSLLLLAGVLFFFAYNWDALHRLAKLALLLGAVAAAALAAWRLGEGTAGQYALLFAAVLVGPLLAVYGQAYQTGADAWELFLGWGLLVLPWVALARFSPLWLLELLIVDVGLALYSEQVLGDRDAVFFELLLALALLNGLAWVLHEAGAQRGLAWLQSRWLPRVLSLLTLGPLLVLATTWIIAPEEARAPQWLGSALLLMAGAGVWAFHRRVRRELFLLTACAACALVLLSTAAGRLFFDALELRTLGMLLMGLLIVGEVALAVTWLRAESHGAGEG
jgi:uncharacterized membrane protein